MDYSTFPLFRHLEPDELASFLADCDEVSHPAGHTFINQGSKGEHVFYLLEGEVLVVAEDEHGEEHELAVLTAPAVVGELEALTGDPRAATVRTKTAARLLEMPFESLRSRLAAGDSAALKVFFHTARVIAHRLAAMDRKFAELQRAPGARVHELRSFQEKLLNEWTM